MDRPDEPIRAGADRGEKPREVTGEALNHDDADAFAALLGVEPEA